MKHRYTFFYYTFLTFPVILHTFIPIASCQEQSAEAEGGGDDEATEEPTCKKSIFNLVQGFLNATLTCLGGKLVLRSPFELTTRFYCIVKCTMMELGVIGPEGILDEVGALFYFQEVIPESIRETVIGGAQPCLALADGFNPKEYYCQSYSAFTQCTLPSLLQTLGPYVLECFSTPALGFFFNFIDLMVPRASSPAASAVRTRFSDQRLQFRRRHPNSSNNVNANARMGRNTSIVIPSANSSTYQPKSINATSTTTTTNTPISSPTTVTQFSWNKT